MNDLMTMAQAHLEAQDRLEKRIEELKQELTTATHQRNILQGQLSESQRLYDQARAESDHHLRWSTEVTRQLYNVGNIVNEAVALARDEMQKAGINSTPVADASNNHSISTVEKWDGIHN